MAGRGIRVHDQTIMPVSTARAWAQSAMSRVHDALDDLLHAPGIHSLPLLDGERVVGRVQLHEGTRWPGAREQTSLVVVYRDSPESPCRASQNSSAAPPVDVVDFDVVAGEAVAAQREPHAVVERLAMAAHRESRGIRG